jgi:hypothetical protein
MPPLGFAAPLLRHTREAAAFLAALFAARFASFPDAESPGLLSGAAPPNTEQQTPPLDALLDAVVAEWCVGAAGPSIDRG